MHSNDTGRIDEHVTTPLAHVSCRLFGEVPARHFLQIGPPGSRSPDFPKTCVQHTVCVVYSSSIIDQEGPPQSGILRVAARQISGLESNHHDANIPVPEFLLALLQLQQMALARQSAQVPMENHQQPCPPVILYTMHPAVEIRKF